jgi:hypothetical protein
MLNDDMESKIKDISDMLENDLADNEETGVEATIVKGYGHGDDIDMDTRDPGSPRV